MGNPNKDKNQGGDQEGTMGGDLTSPWDAHQAACDAACDVRQERDSWDATLAKQVAEAVAR